MRGLALLGAHDHTYVLMPLCARGSYDNILSVERVGLAYRVHAASP